MNIPGFQAATCMTNGRRVVYDVAGRGSPVLLLHGFPQTRLTWRGVAPLLVDDFEVVCPDLPGYGESDRLDDGPEGFDKSRIGDHFVRLMSSLGHDRFAVIGHDRGALVAFRMALDHPKIISQLGVLDVIPTVDNWAALQGPGGVFAFHLFLLAQPSDLPERMIGADPDTFFGHFLDNWTQRDGAIPPEIRTRYLEAMRRPETIHAVCDDYRASAFIDGRRDEADRKAGRRLDLPVLAAWQDPGEMPLPFDPEQIWSSWASELRTRVEPCGHFLPEERPHQIADAVKDLVDSGSGRS